MVRIGGGVYGDVHEEDYLAGGVDYTTGPNVTPAMKNSLMYKLCYYRFAEVWVVERRNAGFCVCVCVCVCVYSVCALCVCCVCVYRLCVHCRYAGALLCLGYVGSCVCHVPAHIPIGPLCPLFSSLPTPPTKHTQVQTSAHAPAGFDRVRHYEIGEKDVHLEHMEEAFTSDHWIVRIYKVKKPANREEVE